MLQADLERGLEAALGATQVAEPEVALAHQKKRLRCVHQPSIGEQTVFF